MITLNIEYNPYLIQSKFLLDGKNISKESKLNEFKNKKLQLWISKLLDILKEELKFDELKIIFKGRKLDYQDVVNILKDSQNNVLLEYIPIMDSEERIKKLKKLFKKIQKGPYEELKSEKVKEYFDKTFSSEFEIGVIATVSSGKSTLLNSILGKDLIPAKNQACTAKISKIYNEKKEFFSGKAFKKELDNEGKIIGEKLIQTFDNLTQEDLIKLNEDNAINKIEIFGNVKNIYSDELKLVLIDTPGPNNAADLSHKELTYELIAKDYKPLILYVLNYQQLGITDDKKLLEDIGKEIQKSGDSQSSERFIFVLNKFDSKFESTNDDPIEKTIEIAKQHLKNVGILNPIIIPTSAMTALLLRENKFENDRKLRRIRDNKIADLIENYEDDNFNINNYMEIPQNIVENINLKIENSDNEEKQAELLTGVPALEEYITEYLSKYALPEKIKKAAETFEYFIKKEEIESKMFDAIKNNEEKMKQTMNAINELEKNYSQKLPEIRKKLEVHIEKIKKSAKNKIEDYEIKIEKSAQSMRKTSATSTSNRSSAMNEVRSYISDLQSEYLKLKTQMNEELKKTLNLQVKELTQFYEKEVKNISNGTIDKDIANTLKEILNLNIKDKINFDENKLDDILYKTRT